MKKRIVFIFIIALLSLGILGSLAWQKDKKVKQEVKKEKTVIVKQHHYHCGKSGHCSSYADYDLDTFLFNEEKNEISVDLIYNFDFYPQLYYVKSPYDNNLITHLIFGITYSLQTNTAVLEYKGFISSYRNEEKNIFDDIRIYYENNKEFFPDFDVYMEDLGLFLDKTKVGAVVKYKDVDESIKYFYNAYKIEKLYELEDIHYGLVGEVR